MVNRVWETCAAAAVVLLLSACIARSQTLPPTRSIEQHRIFIADRGNDRIVRLDDLTGVGRVTLGTRGSGKNQFYSPSSALVDTRGRIYVADSGNARIVRVNDMTGTGWTVFRPRLRPGEPLWHPLGLAMDRLGHIYVTSLHSVFQMNDMDGSGWRTFGAMGSGPGQYALATGIFVDGDHRIYVADASNHRIVRMDDMSGAGWTTLGTLGSGKSEFHDPGSVFVDASTKRSGDHPRLIVGIG